jgi:hypothetical protein
MAHLEALGFPAIRPMKPWRVGPGAAGEGRATD